MEIALSAAIALLLPWLAGSTWTYWLLSRSSQWHPAAVLGHGYLLGLFATTLIMRIFHWAGLQQSFTGTSLALCTLTLAGMVLLYLRPAEPRIKTADSALPGWQKAVIALLLGLIALRYATIFQELILRPLFPWDAWMNWAPKALVWFHYSDLVPFRSQTEWLAAPADALVHMDGAKNAWKYPIGVPLVQLWGMLAIGTSDSSAIYLPWLYIALAIGLITYGHLRLVGSGVMLSTVAVYALVNLPFVNVHSALAGYADLWVAIVFGAGVMSLSEWNRCRQWPHAIIALLFAVFCAQLKVPGLIMCGIIITGFILSLVQLPTKIWWALVTGTAGLALIVLLAGIEFNIPDVGRVSLNQSLVAIPYIGEFEIAFYNVNHAMIDTLFTMINWNLLWYCLIAVLPQLALKPGFVKAQSLEFVILAMTLGFLFFVYYFTERYLFALDYSQVNRALVYAIPLIVFILARQVSLYVRHSKATR